MKLLDSLAAASAESGSSFGTFPTGSSCWPPRQRSHPSDFERTRAPDHSNVRKQFVTLLTVFVR